jgi:hypothetical protein
MTQPKVSPVRAVAKDLLRGAVIGFGIYVVWVIAHALLFGMLGG